MRTVATVLVVLFVVPPCVSGQRKQVIFKEVAEQVGLKFQHYNGMTGKFYQPEITGSGGALFDFGCYGADLMTYLMDGARPLTVTAVRATSPVLVTVIVNFAVSPELNDCDFGFFVIEIAG